MDMALPPADGRGRRGKRLARPGGHALPGQSGGAGVADQADRDDVPPKPTCRLDLADGSGLSIPYRVRDVLYAAGLHEAANGFLRRAVYCRSREQLIHLAAEYVTIEDPDSS